MTQTTTVTVKHHLAGHAATVNAQIRRLIAQGITVCADLPYGGTVEDVFRMRNRAGTIEAKWSYIDHEGRICYRDDFTRVSALYYEEEVPAPSEPEDTRTGAILGPVVGISVSDAGSAVAAYMAAQDAPAPAPTTPSSLDYSSTQLDAPARTQRIIADACQRSLDAKRLIWVASFDPGAEWGQGRCWYNTDIEPLATDRIEGIARAGHYMPVCPPR